METDGQNAPFVVNIQDDGTDTAFTGCMGVCPAGTFGNRTDHLDPSCSGVCPSGHYCDAGSTAPTPCPPGTHLLTSSPGTSINSCLPYAAHVSCSTAPPVAGPTAT